MTRAFASYQDGTLAYRQNVTVDYPVSPKIGDLCRVGDAVGYALGNEDSAGKTLVDFGPREIEGVVAAATGNAITVGETIYFADTAAPLTNDTTSAKKCAIALGAIAAASSATIRVLLNPGGW